MQLLERASSLCSCSRATLGCVDLQEATGGKPGLYNVRKYSAMALASS